MQESLQTAVIELLHSQSALIHTHLTEATQELEQIKQILDQAVIKLEQSFHGIHYGLEQKNSLNHSQQTLLNQHLNQAIIGLQFHDLTSQLLERSQSRLQGLTEILSHSALPEFNSDQDGLLYLQKIQTNQQQLSDGLQGGFKLSLLLEPMEIGDVELF